MKDTNAMVETEATILQRAGVITTGQHAQAWGKDEEAPPLMSE